MLDEPPNPTSPWNLPDFRPEMAFPKLTEEMVQRIAPFGHIEELPAGFTLSRQRDRQVDLIVVLDGEIEVSMPSASGERVHVAGHKRLEFTGELNLLNSQGAIVEQRTVTPTRILRVTREDLPRLMRAEGDISNLIAQAVVWRRIGIILQAKGGILVHGDPLHPDTTQIQRFLIRNIYPHFIVPVSAADAAAGEYPVISLPGDRSLVRPTITHLAEELGISELPDPARIYDVAVVGAGPSGLAAAVYAASEGLSTTILEGIAPGGQAATSSKIENYLGFPTGISGQRLASRAQLQALKFGVRFSISRDVISAEQLPGGIHRLTLAGGFAVCARAVVIATGAQYRRLSLENYDRFENLSIHYAATTMESSMCRDHEVIVIGGGNSAGQASVFLSGIARHVHHIVRGPSLAATMSQYLISRIENSSRITLYTRSEITALEGRQTLEHVTWKHRRTGQETRRPVRSVFVMIGAEPNSGWLYGTVKLDRKGFVLTGGDNAFDGSPYATNVPGIFAVGDVRANSVKRVASAVGEGSVVISDIHRYLTDHRHQFPVEPDSALAALRMASPATDAATASTA